MTDTPPPFDPVRHRRGGRRPKDEAERRDLLIQVRVSPKERDRAAVAAAAAGLTLSQYTRAAFNGAIVITVSQTAPPEVLRQLRLLNLNMNQILHQSRLGVFSAPDLEAAAVEAMRTVSGELRRLIHAPEC